MSSVHMERRRLPFTFSYRPDDTDVVKETYT